MNVVQHPFLSVSISPFGLPLNMNCFSTLSLSTTSLYHNYVYSFDTPLLLVDVVLGTPLPLLHDSIILSYISSLFLILIPLPYELILNLLISLHQ